MFRNPLFREQALIRNAQPEPLDDLLRVTAPHQWLLLLALAGSLLAVVVWGTFASLERTVSIRGVLVHPGERHTVLATAAGVVTTVTAVAGDRVEAGQTIARLAVPGLDWRLRVARARVTLLERQSGIANAPRDTWLDAELRAARTEVLELAAIQAAGEVVVSPHAGEITSHSLVAGQAVRPGAAAAEVRSGPRRAPEAILIVGREPGPRIEVGMAARVVIAGPAGPGTLAAEIVAVYPRPERLPPWLTRFGLDSSGAVGTPGASARLVRVAVFGADEVQVPDGAPCRVTIILERLSPFGLLASALGPSQ